QHRGDLPHQVVAVLNRCVCTQSIAGRVAMDGVSDAEHAAGLQMSGPHLVDAPQRNAEYLDVNVGFTDQISRDLDCGGVIDQWRLIVDVVSPVDEPFVPRPDHPYHSGADTPHVGARLNHEVQCRRSMCAQVGEIGFEHDAHRAVYVHLTLERQADLGG